MSLLKNGDFITPLLPSNQYISILDGTYDIDPNFEEKLIWNTTLPNDIRLINREAATNLNYPLPSSLGKIQMLDLRHQATIFQSINLPVAGEYEIGFYYATRGGYPLLPISILINGVVIYDINWSRPAYTWINFKGTVNIDTPKNI